MAVSDQFLNHVLDQLSHWEAVFVRRMFGGAGLYRDGKIFCVIADDVAYLKVDDASRDDFVKAGCSPFNPYPELNKATVFSYYEVPPEVLENRDDFRRWAQRSLNIQEKRNAGLSAGDAKTA
jgi:DNA transformation protein and related proteins